MAKLSNIAIDMKKSIDGIWIPFAAGIEFKIARMNNPEHTAYLKKITEPSEIKLKSKINKNLINELTTQSIAKCILVDWKNIEDDQGNPIPYSFEKALEILKNPQYVEILNFVAAMAASIDLYKEDVN